MNEAVVIDENWEIESNDFLKGHYTPDQVGVELIRVNRQKDRTWCTGFVILSELKKMEATPVGEASSPEHFPGHWHGKKIAILGTRYIQKRSSSVLRAIRLHTWSDGEGRWSYRMKPMDSEFGIHVERNEHLWIPVFKILG